MLSNIPNIPSNTFTILSYTIQYTQYTLPLFSLLPPILISRTTALDLVKVRPINIPIISPQRRPNHKITQIERVHQRHRILLHHLAILWHCFAHNTKLSRVKVAKLQKICAGSLLHLGDGKEDAEAREGGGEGGGGFADGVDELAEEEGGAVHARARKHRNSCEGKERKMVQK